MTSHDVVAVLRRITKIKQIGHTGTLDPFAEGVLPICIGKATRLIEYLNDDKSYLAYVQLGEETSTYDKEGETVSKSEKKVNENEVLTALKDFEGEIMQIPPMYSAIKIKGKKLYEYAREGKEIEVEPRKVTIEEISLKDFDFDNQVAQIYIKCSKGTYIRSIAHDLGEKLGCGAHLTRLIRKNAGKFNLDTAIPLENITTIEQVKEILIEPLTMLEMPILELNETEHQKVLCGQFLENKNYNHGDFIILVYNKKINAIALVSEDKIKVKKVFEL